MSDTRETRLQPLLSSNTVSEVLETAMTFELNASRFYRSLGERVRPDTRPLLHELADEEMEHHRLLSRFSRGRGVVSRPEQRIRRSATADVFAAFVHLPELPPDPLDDDLLAYAQDRERVAFEHYAHLAEITPNGPLRDLFCFLRDEERKHEERISSRWATMFSIF